MSAGFVGRAAAMAELMAALDAAAAGRGSLALVSGEAGIGKTAVLAELADRARARGALVAWGTCWDDDRAPAFWPWTQAVREVAAAADRDTTAAIDSDGARAIERLLGHLPADDAEADDSSERFRLLDGVISWLDAVAATREVVVVLDDLQWADPSSLALLERLGQRHRRGLLVAGSFRHDEVTGATADTLTALAPRSRHVHLTGLTETEVGELLTAMGYADARRHAEVHRRSAGHPFFARELALLFGSESVPSAHAVPAMVRDVIRRRLARLDDDERVVLATAAVSGNDIDAPLLADALDRDDATVLARLASARSLGVVVGEPGRFAHDLYREVLEDDLDVETGVARHLALADALGRRGRRSDATAIARHTTAAAARAGPERTAGSASAAAAIDRQRLAFTEAAGHLARARAAIEALPGSAPYVVDLLIEEADTWARGGDVERARALLGDAADRADAIDDAPRTAAVALGHQHLGARFAMPRDEVVALLEHAVDAVGGTDARLEAQLTAALSRELLHSVPAERPRAVPLSERALSLAREVDDPATLADCLLARHDALWSPGRAAERLMLAREIAKLARDVGDEERRGQGVLLAANALLELGDPACRVELDRYLTIVEQLNQPRHRYYALTRRAAVALLDGRLDEGERLVEAAYEYGAEIGEPDAGNVRLSQLLEVVRASGDAERLRATADEAVRWWVGIPSHAHAVAAGFLAIAGDRAGAEAALRTVKALGAWDDDQSYMRNAFIGPLTIAATTLADEPLCRALLDALEPVMGACGVNGAFVCFTGANAHWGGLLAAALGRADDAEQLLGRALAVHERLGARAWVDATSAALGSLRAAAPANGVWRRAGDVWDITYAGTSARLRDSKGLADLAVLIADPGRDVHVLTLTGASALRGPGASIPVLDDAAKRAYQRRLERIGSDIDDADARGDASTREQLETERDAIVDELRRATGLGGRSRALDTDAGERARKAVSARVREAVRRIADANPALGRHLDESITTGMVCRYAPAPPVTWDVRR